MFENLKNAINAALDAATPLSERGANAGTLEEAAIAARAGIDVMRRDLAKAEQEAAVERQQLEDARRRGELARQIDDADTVEVAERFVARHAEKVGVLEQKAEAQRAELALAERELGEIMAQLKTLKGRGPADTSGRIEQAWRHMQAAGGARPGVDDDDAHDALKHQVDRASREATAEAQLQELKKRMGKS